MKLKNNLCVILIFSIIFSVLSINISADNTELSWFIKRNGQCQPKLCKSQEFITEYNAYYIDTTCSDNSEKKIIYLTYDAGYENGNLEKTLDILKEENVPAAFFILDNIILKNAELVTRMANEGHTICNHTKNHKNISGYSKESIKKNLEALEMLCEEKTGISMSKYFRFPEGKYSEQSLKYVSELGYKTIFWSFAYEDWDNNKQMSEAKAMKKILSNTHNGAIILFHPNSETNVKILPALIKQWKNDGYSFGTLDELCK